MTNFIRACFYLEKLTPSEKYYALLKTLHGLQFQLSTQAGWVNGSQLIYEQHFDINETKLEHSPNQSILWQLSELLNTAEYITIKYKWQLSDNTYNVQLLSLIQEPFIRFVFAVEDRIFLPGATTQWNPKPGNHEFLDYKNVLVAIINHLQPKHGVIDYEADLLCPTSDDNGALAYWGNYFTLSTFKRWKEKDKIHLREIVDEYIEIDDVGVLTFIHPLMANQAWTDKHTELEKLLQGNTTVFD